MGGVVDAVSTGSFVVPARLGRIAAEDAPVEELADLADGADRDPPEAEQPEIKSGMASTADTTAAN